MKKIFFLIISLLLTFNLQTDQIVNKNTNIKNISIQKIDYEENFPKLTVYYTLTDEKNRFYKSKNINQEFLVELNKKSIKTEIEISVKVLPASAVILLDASGSISPETKQKIIKEISAFYAFIRVEDEAAFFIFNNDLLRLQPLTNEKTKLIAALEKFQPSGTLSRIYESIYDSLSYLRDNAKNNNKLVIIVSDGLDEGSRRTSIETIALAKSLNIPVFAMGFTNVNPLYLENLKQIVGETKGIYSLENKDKIENTIFSKKTVYKLIIPWQDLKKTNTLRLTFTKQNIFTEITFNINDEIYNRYEKLKSERCLIFLLIGIAVLILIIILIIILLIKINKKKSKGLTKQEALFLSKSIYEDAENSPVEVKKAYLKAGLNDLIGKADFSILLERQTKELNSKNEDTAITIIKKLQLIYNKNLDNYSLKNIFVEPYKTKTVHLIEGRTVELSNEDKQAFSCIVLSILKDKMDKAKKEPLTLEQYDHFSGLITKTNYTEKEIKNLIQVIEKGESLVDKNIFSKARIGFDNLTKLITINGRRSYKLGVIIVDPYLADIKSRLSKYEEKLNVLSDTEKEAMARLAGRFIDEHKDKIDFFKDLLKKNRFTQIDLSDLYKLLSSEMMCAALDEKEKGIDCSALFKLSIITDKAKKGIDKADLFNYKDEKWLINKILEILNEQIRPEIEKSLNEIFNDFENDNDKFELSLRQNFLSPSDESSLPDTIENFLFRAFSAGSEGFDFNSVFRDISSYDPETLAKLMPYMIQAVKDSQGSEKEANLGILKNMALNLKLDPSKIGNINDWEDWWKNNKQKVMSDIALFDEKKNIQESEIGFSIHEDIVFYKIKNNNLVEISGRIIYVKENEITLLLHEYVSLEAVIALYARKHFDDVYINSTYIFLRSIRISEIEDNVYENSFTFLTEKERGYAQELESYLIRE